MAVLRLGATGLLLLAATITYVAVLPFLGLPGSTPDLVLVVVAAVGLATGEVPGAVTGLVAGLLVDVTPPTQSMFGLSAVILVLVGAVAGAYGRRSDRGALATLALVAGLAAASVIGRAVVGGVLGADGVPWDRVPILSVTNALYAVVLAAFVVPGVRLLLREPDRVL